MDIKELENKIICPECSRKCNYKDCGTYIWYMCPSCGARMIEKAILPASSSLKLIDNTEANGYGFPFRVFEAWKDGRNKQLASCEKAHASILAEKAREQYEAIINNSKVYNGYGDRLIRASDLRKVFNIPEPENPGC